MSDSPEAERTQNLWPYVLAIIVFFAVLVRLVGFNWGLPNESRWYSYHPDEPIVADYSQQLNPAALDFDPGFYNYGTLYLTTLKVAGDVAQFYAGITPETLQKDPFQKQRVLNQVGRGLNVVAGAATVALVFLILCTMIHWTAGAFGAATILFASGHVMHSAFQTVDVYAVFWLTLAAFAVLKYPNDGENPNVKWLVLAGVAIGLSAATKYTGILGVLILIPTVLQYGGKQKVAHLGIGVGVALVAFVLGVPGILINNPQFIKDFVYEMNHTSTGHGLVFEGTPSGFIYHLGNLFAGYGTILTVLGLAGLALGVKRKEPLFIGLLIFCVVNYLLIGRAEVKFFRYVLPFLPFLAVGVGYLIRDCFVKAGKFRIVVALYLVGLIGLDGGGISGFTRYAVQMLSPDPRDQARDFLVKENKSVGLVSSPWFYTPPFFPVINGPRYLGNEVLKTELAKVEVPPVTFTWREPLSDSFDFDLDLLTVTKPEYVVISSFESKDPARIERVGTRNEVAKIITTRYGQFRDRLNQDYKLDRIFGGGSAPIHDLEYHCPTVWIWKRKAP